MSKTAANQFPPTLSGLSPEEAEKAYRRVLDSRNSLKAENDKLWKWAKRTNRAVTILSCEGSLAFQAMAEKAGVRNHPSVQQAVRAFDSISHPQWESQNVDFPTDWEFEASAELNDGAGDADMSLNSELYEVLQGPPWENPKITTETIKRFFRAARKKLDEIRTAAGARSYTIRAATQEVRGIGWAALDLAQDMNMARCMLRRDLRAAAYRRIEEDLYALAYADHREPVEEINFDIKVFGDVAPS